jgi:hypothetical protein
VSYIRRTSATQNSVNGALLSDKYALPGTITFVGINANQEGTYKFGTAEAGGQTSDVVRNFSELPHIKACSKFAGGALVLQFNAEGRADSLLRFKASTNEDDLSLPGFCPRIVQVNPVA